MATLPHSNRPCIEESPIKNYVSSFPYRIHCSWKLYTMHLINLCRHELGILTVNPTVMPAIASDTKSCFVYNGNHVKMGKWFFNVFFILPNLLRSLENLRLLLVTCSICYVCLFKNESESETSFYWNISWPIYLKL